MTLVGYGKMVGYNLEAAEELQKEGISCEVSGPVDKCMSSSKFSSIDDRRRQLFLLTKSLITFGLLLAKPSVTPHSCTAAVSCSYIGFGNVWEEKGVRGQRNALICNPSLVRNSTVQ